MADLAEAREVAHRIHDIVRSLSSRLINDKRSVEWRRLRLAWHGMVGGR
jgi:hypothetical protein